MHGTLKNVSDSLIGTVVDGRYAITALIGRGGMATVYRARDKRLERDIAIKLMHPHLAEKPDLNTRFNKEARTAAQLTSPYIVAIHDQGVWTSPDGPRAYLVMEHVPGPDLRTELQRLGSLSLGAYLNLTENVLHALADAHNAGIVHRDVKPENILLSSPLPSIPSNDDKPFKAKVADFGLAHVADSDSFGSGTLLGTVAYIPPESISSGVFEPTADLYAFGIMMYEVLAGQLPFKGETPLQTAYMHINEPMPSVADKAEWMPPEIDAFIARLTAKDPSERPLNGQKALEEFLAVRESVPEDMYMYRVPVIPAPPPASLEEEDPEPYQEKTEAYVHTPNALLVDDDASAHTDGPPTETISIPPVAPNKSVQTAVFNTSNDSFSDLLALPPDDADDEEKKDSALAGITRTLVRKRWPVALLVVLMLALTSTGGWYFLFGPGQRVPIPDVAGKNVKVAEKILTDSGFVVKKQEAYSDDVEKGLVISTNPHSKSVRIGSTVTIIVSLGIEKVEVPSVVSLSREDALAKLEAARLRPIVTESYSEDVEENLVISQSLDSGKIVNHDSEIDIVISKGREPIDVPALTNMSRDDAVQALESAGLQADISEDFSATVPAGQIISQTPADGTLYRGDTVSLVISKGPPTVQVPNVTRLSVEEARAQLEAAGLQVEVAPFFGSPLWNKVYTQSPVGGQTVPVGSSVRITIV